MRGYCYNFFAGWARIIVLLRRIKNAAASNEPMQPTMRCSVAGSNECLFLVDGQEPIRQISCVERRWRYPGVDASLHIADLCCS